MRALRFISRVTLVLLATTVAASAQLVTRPLTQIVFQDYSHLFARIVQERKLGNPGEEGLMRDVQAQSKVEHFKDGLGSPIDVVKVELLNKDGTSRTRSKYGNYPFYVVRETPRGLLLMGPMFGRTYRSTFANGSLDFLVDLHSSAAKVVQMRFRVEAYTLVNLTPQGPKRKTSDGFIAIAAR